MAGWLSDEEMDAELEARAISAATAPLKASNKGLRRALRDLLDALDGGEATAIKAARRKAERLVEP